MKRTFINAKQYLTTALNVNTRTDWLKDYLKSIASQMQVTNSNFNNSTKITEEYLKYNGQVASLRTFLNDKYDPHARRTLILERVKIGNYVFYSYFDNDEWNYETDTNPTSMYSYYENGVWHSEPATENIYFLNYLLNGEWVEESVSSINLSFYIHNDIYSSLSSIQKEEINELLNRYVPAPYVFEVKGYETNVIWNGTSDYVNTKITPNVSTVLSGKVSWQGSDIARFGSLSSNASFAVGISSANKNNCIYGNVSSSATSMTRNTIYLQEINGATKKIMINGSVNKNADNVTFTTNNNPIFFGGSNSGTSISYASYTQYAASINKDGIEFIFSVHPSGYLFDNFGNIYYNREESYNKYPLTVSMNIY